ncbi:DUF3108 domain-containing protein [Luteibacter sp. 329MFSha]|uniref:DUF3108 domain-containing protein n=1 Tax=Luteibacter sp. 329MFSha TaxID=1798239 RepID=UPI0008C10DB8|nr:DUF3108 domain-containing protein [Luteibacter sp. 329MFSha]SEW04440.1 Protein of unknown function [Luteibacter sp. 329MFSha]
MKTTTLLRAGFALALALPAAAFAASVPQAFTATYNVLQGGSPLGTATIQLKPTGNGQFEYTNQSKGTAGIAAMLGASVSETSRFSWAGNVPQLVSYRYDMQAIKPKTREVTVQGATVQVQDNKKSYSYASVPGMVDRNTLPLALGVALGAGQKDVTLPVAVKQAVENQQFRAAANEQVKVEAGTFNAVRVDRVDEKRGFTAWYVPKKYPVPVKLAQTDGGDLTLELVSYSGK